MRWAEICKKIQKEENRGATLAHGVPAVTWQESQAWGITAHRRAQWRQILSYCTTAHTITGNWNILLRQLHPVRLLLVWVIELQACRDAEFTLNHSHFLLSSSLHFLPLSLLLTRWLALSTELSFICSGKSCLNHWTSCLKFFDGGQAKSSGFSLAFIPLLYLGIALTLPQNFPHLAWPWDLFSIPEFSIPVGRMNVKHGGL